MERLWENAERSAIKQRPDSQALDYSVCSGRSVIVNGHQNQQQQQQPEPASSRVQLIHGGGVDGNQHRMLDDEEDDTPMICMICEDKATGLHYGIITCEGYLLLNLFLLAWTNSFN
jgi:hypothetical protein